MPCELDAMCAIARRHGLRVIEDAVRGWQRTAWNERWELWTYRRHRVFRFTRSRTPTATRGADDARRRMGHAAWLWRQH
jgi:hypothetical protein